MCPQPDRTASSVIASVRDTDRDLAIAEVGREFGVLFQRIRRRWKELAQSIHPELQPLAYKVLALLVMEGAMPASRLAERLEVDKSTLSRQFALLESLGFVERRSDEADGRIRLIAATPDAVTAVASARATSQAEFEAELAEWSADEISTFGRMLKKLSTVT